jgi:hypothetical protein
MKKLVLTILLAFSLLTVQAATPKVIFEPYDAVRQAALAQIKDALSIYQDMNSVKFQEYRDVILDSLKTSIDLFSCAEFEQYPASASADIVRLITMPSELTTPYIFEWINEDYSVGTATYTDGPAHGKSNYAFAGSVLMPNGKVMLTPRNSDNIGIYDPVEGTYADGPAHGKGLYAFYDSTLLPNGKVMLTPYKSANIGIYDPVANTYTDGPEHGKGSNSNAFYGSTLLPNGKVMLTPYTSAKIGIYDPVEGTYADGPAHGKGLYAFSGSTLLPNGKVILTPSSSDNIGIYDPGDGAVGTYTDGPAHGKDNDAFAGSVLLPNGKVMLTPYTSAKIGIYDPAIIDLELRDWPLLSAYFNKF